MAAHSAPYPAPRALVSAAIVTATIAFLLAANDASTLTALVTSAGSGAFTVLLLHRPRSGARGPDRILTFRTPEQLRAARTRLLDARRVHADRLRERQTVRRRLADLLDRMGAVGLSAYSSRRVTIERGLATLDRQIAVITALRDGYDRSIRLIDVELEAGHAAELLDEDIGSAIGDALYELQLLEESQAELARQVAANDEVDGVTAAASSAVRRSGVARG